MRLKLATLLLLSVTALHAEQRWIGTWAAAPVRVSNTSKLAAEETTVRQLLHISQGGESIRIALTNELGKEPLNIKAAYLGFHGAESDLVTGTNHPLLFSGKPDVTIAPGTFVTSDPVVMRVPIFSDLVVSLDLPAQTLTALTAHTASRQTNYTAPGNQAAEIKLQNPKSTEAWYFVKNAQVPANGKKSAVVVTFGDSITDGNGAIPNASHRWPDILAVRLAAYGKTKRLAVMNQGIGGNRILHESSSPMAVERFDRDVLQSPGIKYLIVMLGINDIGRTYVPQHPGDHEEVTPKQMEDALEDMARKAHAKGIRVYGATLTAFEGSLYYTEAGERDRQTLNQWIRTTKAYDGVIDFDQMTRDPEHPTRLKKEADKGDHLHPGDTGYPIMANGINLKLFKK